MGTALDTTLKLRLASSELARWNAEASERGLSVAALVRAAVSEGLEHRLPAAHRERVWGAGTLASRAGAD